MPQRLHRSLQQSKALDAEPEDDDDDFDLDVQVAYRDPRVAGKRKQTNEDVSDYVSFRLELARENALTKYREIWG